MDIVILLIVSLMWSIVGTFIKVATSMVSSSLAAFLRFSIGVVFLAIFMLIKEKKITLNFRNKWIWIGAVGKCANYIFENIGISIGYSYGNILATPIQASIVAIVSSVYLKEKLNLRQWISVGLCIVGVFLVSWNGVPIKMIFTANGFTTLLFTLSALGIAAHFFSQKMLIETVSSSTMNISIFILCSAITALPLPFTSHITGEVNAKGIIALLALGAITGTSFYLYANALKKIPLLIANIIGNSSILLNILWGWLFFKEPVTIYIILGALVFIGGIILLNLPKKIKFNKSIEEIMN